MNGRMDGRPAPGHEAAIAKACIGLAVAERRAVDGNDAAARCRQHGMGRCRIPFHRGSKPWIDVGGTFRDFAEFQ